jgi:hypothetical protein
MANNYTQTVKIFYNKKYLMILIYCILESCEFGMIMDIDNITN